MIFISTNMYRPESLEKVYKITDNLDFKIGIEIFPMFQDSNYEALLEKNIEKLKNYDITFHEPYFETCHSFASGSETYKKTEDFMERAFKYAEMLKAKYMVYHYNNKKIENKEEMLKNTRENLRMLSKLAPCPLLIENTGVEDRGNVLLKEDEYIEECKNAENLVLIDIGHANANSWNLENVIKNLKDKIMSYHLHTNDGVKDEHKSMFEENKSPSIPEFIELYKKYTPKAHLVVEYSNYYEDKEDRVIEDIKKLNFLL